MNLGHDFDFEKDISIVAPGVWTFIFLSTLTRLSDRRTSPHHDGTTTMFSAQHRFISFFMQGKSINVVSSYQRDFFLLYTGTITKFLLAISLIQALVIPVKVTVLCVLFKHLIFYFTTSSCLKLLHNLSLTCLLCSQVWMFSNKPVRVLTEQLDLLGVELGDMSSN